MGQRYKYEISTSLNGGAPSSQTIRLEGMGQDRHELLKNCYVYLLDESGGEMDCMHMNNTADFIFGQCINAVRAVLTNEEMAEVTSERL